MKVLSIQDFCKSKNFTQVAKSVRTNVNKYPFVTFIDPTKPREQQAENIYFSKSAAKNVTNGELITKDLLSTHQIAIVMNANNEERVKLIGNTERLNISDLLG